MIKSHILFRKIHFWLSMVILVPIIVVVVSGILLQVKKESDWVQPPSQKGSASFSHSEQLISLPQMLAAAQRVEPAAVSSWHDIDRLDVRPDKGIVKIQTNNQWEIQLDATTGELLSTAYRRSDLIETIHDGSFFHDKARLGLFLPVALGLLVLTLSGGYILTITLRNKRRSRLKKLHAGPQNRSLATETAPAQLN